MKCCEKCDFCNPYFEDDSIQLEPSSPRKSIKNEDNDTHFMQCKEVQSGARWLFWIAGLSAINAIAVAAKMDYNFVIGLVINDLWRLMFKSTRTVLVLSLVISAFIGFLGLQAKQLKKWAFVCGIIIYLIDFLVLIIADMYISIAFHLWAMIFIIKGFLALRKLNVQSINQDRGFL